MIGRLTNLFAPRAPLKTRVGVLNTGELVLISPCDQAQILSAATTAEIRWVLAENSIPATLGHLSGAPASN